MPTTADLTASKLPATAIVIGSGLAGLSASSQLLYHKIPVILLERSLKPGGNSIKASSGINGAPTVYQSLAFPGGEDDRAFYADTIKSAGGVFLNSRTKERERLIATLTSKSRDAIDWLVQENGLDLSVVVQLGGHSVARTHRGSGKTPPGAAIISALLIKLHQSPDFRLQAGCTVTKLLKESNAVVGVEYVFNTDEGEEMTNTLYGPVIFATGGFGGDTKTENGMLAVYRRDLYNYPSTNEERPGSHSLLVDVGAKVMDMNMVQVHPTAFIDPNDFQNPVKFLAAEMLRGEGGCLLDAMHWRFVNELETRKVVTDAITKMMAVFNNEGQEEIVRMWDLKVVIDEGVYQSAKSHVDFYIWRGLMRKTTISDLGPLALESIKSFSDAAAGLTVDPFGRKSFGHWKLRDPVADSVVYVGRVTPAVHFTMGGVVINENAEVLGVGDERIEGLWAAGEVTGGVHGENRLGGSSLLECVVFGRVAGDRVARFLRARMEV